MVFSSTEKRKGDASQELTVHQAKTDRQNRHDCALEIEKPSIGKRIFPKKTMKGNHNVSYDQTDEA